jgi:lipopolysaccharide biosynthesis glycosyltransferase
MDILTSAEGPYIPAAEAMLFSFLSQNPGRHSIYMLSQEAPALFRDIGQLCNLAGSDFALLNPNALVGRLEGASTRINRGKSMAQYHRIYASHLLPPELPKVLYLDADLLVRHSLAGLWAIELGDDYLAASSMSASIKNRDFLAKFGGRYFNSGVMLINLGRWRRDNVSGECERILSERPQDVTFWDQCLLNFACPTWREFGIEYNYYYAIGPRWASKFGLTKWQFRAIAANPAILHFIGPYKPWKKEPADLRDLEREYPLCREAFERAIADQHWTGLSIHQQQAEARVAEKKALRRAERRRRAAAQRQLERKATRKAAKRQARVDERRLERKSLRTTERKALRSAKRLAQAAEGRTQHKALRREARAEAERGSRKAERRDARRAAK